MLERFVKTVGVLVGCALIVCIGVLGCVLTVAIGRALL